MAQYLLGLFLCLVGMIAAWGGAPAAKTQKEKQSENVGLFVGLVFIIIDVSSARFL